VLNQLVVTNPPSWL